MEIQSKIICDKPKYVFKKRGQEYTRKGYDLKIDTAQRFKRKCDLLGLNETQCVELLVETFVRTTGWGPQVKNAPFLEPRVSEHVRESVNLVVKDQFPWV